MAHLSLVFLGGFQVLLDGRPVTQFKSNKVRALLTYLAVEANRPHRRAALAGLLWPEWPDREALSNLRYTLASLRRTLGEHQDNTPFLLITHDTIQFNRASDAWLDVAEIERQFGSFQPASTASDHLKSALALYHGPFLEGFSLGDAAPFEEWVVLRREQTAHQVMLALDVLIAALDARGDYKEAQRYAHQQVALEPWHEAAHRALMRSLALDGQRPAALHQFQTCCHILHQELGVEPAEETRALYETILADKLTTGQALRRSLTSLHITPDLAPPVVARETQLAQLHAWLAQASAGGGRVVFVTGEAGSGKTALLGEFAQRAMESQADLLIASGACDAVIGIGDPYRPFRDIVQQLTGDIESKRAGTTITPEHARRLWSSIPDVMEALVEHGPGLIDVLVPGTGLALRADAFSRQYARHAWHDALSKLLASPAGDPGEGGHFLRQIDIFEQMTGFLQNLAYRHPLCLVLDDLQWADAGSLSLLFHLGRRLAGSRILVVAAYRPDAISPQPEPDQRSLETVIHELQRICGDPPIDLDACEGRHFVEALLDSQPNHLDTDFREQLYRHTEGHPLFTVELLRGLQERGDLVRTADGGWAVGRTLHWDSLPARVEAVIAERINRLPDRCRDVLAIASVEGEEFTAEIVARVLNVDERTILSCLSSELANRHRLITAVSLRRLGARRLSRFRFRHILFQQYLYDHLDTVRREYWHEALGSTLEQIFEDAPDELDTMASRLAWHFEAAGLAGRAAAYHLRAGNRAVRLSANDEAIAHFSRGSALLDTLPDSAALEMLKLELQLAAVSPLLIARGFWASERLRALESAYEIAQNPVFDHSPQRWMAQATVANVAFWSAELPRSLHMSRQLLQTAEHSQDPQQLIFAHYLIGATCWLLGDLDTTCSHLDRALALYEQRGHQPVDLALGLHVGVTCLTWKAVARWLMGYPDQAAQVMHQALAAARAGGHFTTLGLARVVATMAFGYLGRDYAWAAEQIEELQSPDLQGSAVDAWTNVLTGWIRAEMGQGEAGLVQMQRGIVATDAVGGSVGRAWQRLLLAQGYLRAGQAAAGLAIVDEALAWMESTNVRLLEAEAHRLRGELILHDRPTLPGAASGTQPAGAAACFRHAIDLARQQGARWWELRALVSLCRLLCTTASSIEERAHARQMLADVVGWFSEGFETRDLREARQILDFGF